MIKFTAGLITGIILALSGGASADQMDDLNRDIPAPVSEGDWIVGVTGSLERGQRIVFADGRVVHRASIDRLYAACRAHRSWTPLRKSLCQQVAYAKSEGYDEVQQALAGERLR